MSTSFTYEMKEVTEAHVGDERVIRGLARMKTLPLAPFGNNIRTFDKSRPAYRDMLTQLLSRESGRRFGINNMGARFQASKAIRKSIEDGMELVTVYAEDEKAHGFAQGNHTQHAAMEAQKNPAKYPGVEDAWIPLTILTGSTQAQATETSIAGNTMTAQNISDQLLAGGFYERLIKHLPEKTLEITQLKLGDKDRVAAPYTMLDVVRRIVLWADSSYPLESNQHPSTAYSSPGGVLKRFSRGDFDECIPLVSDIFWFLEQAQNLVVEKNGINKQGKTNKLGRILTVGRGGSGNSNSDPNRPQLMITGNNSKATVSDVWTFPLVAPFRVFVSGSSLLQPREVLWKKYGLPTLAALWQDKNRSYNINLPLNEWCKKGETWEAAAGPLRDDCVAKGLLRNPFLSAE